MNELKTKSLAQIVNENYQAASVFEKYHLDFCCKGKRSLLQACEEGKLSTDELVAALQEAVNANDNAVPVNFSLLPLSQLADYIVSTHHEFAKKEMPQILAYLQRVASKHGSRHPEMAEVLGLFMALKEEMEYHMEKEELTLFPRIKELERQINAGADLNFSINYVQAPVQVMEQEHDHAGGILAEIRELTRQYNLPADACTTYRLSFAALEAFEKDLHQHVHLENNILFSKAIELFKKATAGSLN
jgi:regulator of cell morphogenesis and NO signaling